MARLAMDLKELIDHLELHKGHIIGVGASLGCAVLWSYAELFTASAFSHMIFVDQAPLQNYAADGSWGPDRGSRGCNSASSLAHLQATLRFSQREAYEDTVKSCLAYRSHPLSTDTLPAQQRMEDEEFFVNIAEQGDALFHGDLMADHTALDWRDSIHHSFGLPICKGIKVLVIASDRSGCFPAAGPLTVVTLVNSGRKLHNRESAYGITIQWGGHWCYWENPEKFNSLVIDFLKGDDIDKYGNIH